MIISSINFGFSDKKELRSIIFVNNSDNKISGPNLLRPPLNAFVIGVLIPSII